MCICIGTQAFAPCFADNLREKRSPKKILVKLPHCLLNVNKKLKLFVLCFVGKNVNVREHQPVGMYKDILHNEAFQKCFLLILIWDVMIQGERERER